MAIRWDGLDAELLCVHPCVGISMCVCVSDVHPIIIGSCNLPALRLPSLQQLERGEPEFSMSTRGVTVRTCENSRTAYTLPRSHFSSRALCHAFGESPPKCPTDPFNRLSATSLGSYKRRDIRFIFNLNGYIYLLECIPLCAYWNYISPTPHSHYFCLRRLKVNTTRVLRNH